MTPWAYLVKKVDPHGTVMLVTDESLTLLCQNSHQVFSDGTFRYAPMYFKQLYTFHIFKDGFYIPVAYFLLRDKTEPTYIIALKMLKAECEKLGLSLDVGAFTVDFEKGMLNAIKRVFGEDTEIRCCRFHLAQSWMRWIDQNGLKTTYRNWKSDASLWLRRLFGLPGLKSEDVRDYFVNVYAPTAPKLPKFQELITYITNTYMNPNSQFPPQLWANICNIDFALTTNCCESWHRHFGSFFNSRKGNPNIFEFLDHLKDDDFYSFIKSNSKQETKEADKKRAHLRATYEKLEAKQMTTLDFLETISPSVRFRRKSARIQKKKAQTEAETAASLTCSKCQKVCKSRAGLVRHTNSSKCKN